MDCLRFEKQVQAHLDADLGPDERLRMDEHAARCDACAGLLADYAALFDALSCLQREAAPAGLESAVLSRVDARAFQRPLGARWRRFVAHPETVLSIQAQMAVASTSMLLLVSAGVGHVGAVRRIAARVATWAYASVADVFADLGSGYIAEHWTLLRGSGATLAQALRLIVDAQRGVLASMLLGCAVVLVWIAVARRAHGGRHANLHLV
jgi:predicted anti-sigma-YlaC factor YlaD